MRSKSLNLPFQILTANKTVVMKQILLSFFFSLCLTAAFAQNRDACYNCFGDSDFFSSPSNELAYSAKQLMVYPNPASEYIMLKNSSGVQEVHIFNLVGRKVREFKTVEKGRSYDVAELPNGMYLVQLIDPRGKIMSTHRMNKR